MIETNKISVNCIEYKSDGNTTKKVRRELTLLTENDGIILRNIGYRHIKDEVNPHMDYIDIYKIENGFAVKITGLDFNNLDEKLNRPYGWWPGSPTTKEILQNYNDNDMYNLVKCEDKRAINSYITLYESIGQTNRAEELRKIRETQIQKQEEEHLQRKLKEEQEEAKKAAEEQERQEKLIQDAEEKIKEGNGNKNIDNEQLLLLADKYEVYVHLKTRHNIIENLKSIQADGNSLQITKDKKTHRRPTCDGIFTVFKEIKNKLS